MWAGGKILAVIKSVFCVSYIMTCSPKRYFRSDLMKRCFNTAPVHSARTAAIPSDVCVQSARQWCYFRDATYANVRKRGGVQKSMGNKVPWKTGLGY